MAKAAKKPAPAAAPAGPPSADDLLGALEGSVQETVKEEAKFRPTVNATEDLMVQYAAVVSAYKICESRKDILGAELKREIWTNFTDMWFASKTKPGNPKVETRKNNRVDCSCNYQVRASFKVNAIQGTASARAGVTTALTNVGFTDEMANKIFDENVEIVITTAIRPFNELAKGKWVSGDGGKEFVPATDAQKAVAAKILSYLQGLPTEPLTPAERGEALVKETEFVVKAGFMDRAANYCETADELRALLSVITPGEALAQLKFGDADTLQERNTRIEQFFHTLLFGADGRAVAAA